MSRRKARTRRLVHWWAFIDAGGLCSHVKGRDAVTLDSTAVTCERCQDWLAHGAVNLLQAQD